MLLGERNSWEGLGSPPSSVTRVRDWAVAAGRCEACRSPCTGAVSGVLRACWMLGITAQSSAPRATDHAARPRWEWDSRALWPARRGCVRVSQVSDVSLLHLCCLHLPFSRSNFIPPVWQGWKDCVGRCALKPALYRSKQDRAAARARWGCVFSTFGVSAARNMGLGWEPTPFLQASVAVQNWSAIVTEVCCQQRVGRASALCSLLELPQRGS